MGYSKMICGVYCIENTDTHKKYIGQSKNIQKRWTEHKWSLNNNVHDNDYLQKAWNKYGEDSFTFSILEECNIQQLDAREIYYIQYFKTHERKNGYNLRGGGGRVGDMAPEVIEKLSGKNNPMFGKHHTEETKKKLSDMRKGVYANENHPRCKSVYCIELNQVFWGAKEVEKLYGISGSNICNCCKGKTKSAGKHPETKIPLHWLYLSDAIDKGLYLEENDCFKEVV